MEFFLRLFFILFFFLSFQSSFAKSLYLSALPLPNTRIINLNTNKCDKACLENMLKNGQVFSFLAYYNNSYSNKDFLSKYQVLKMALNIKTIFLSNEISIALLVPKKIIGRYAISTANSVIAYLLDQNINFKFELFNCKKETLPLIQNSINQIETEGYRFVIAPFTIKGVNKLSEINTSLVFYIPTINKSEFKGNNSNFIFGGINYKKQIQKLLTLTNDKIAVFSDESSIGYKLSSFIQSSDKNIIYQKVIPSSRSNFKSILKYNRKLENSSIFLNTPLVKSSLLASQFRFYKIKPYALFSTQVNYNPLLLNLTQYDDRKNFYIANSIGKSSIDLIATNKLLGNNILFDWINYSTSIGIDYLYTLYFNGNAKRLFTENIINNQVNYNISIVKPTKSSFKAVDIYN